MQKYGQSSSPRTKQEITANECPMHCGKESAVLVARPGPGSVATWWSRCQRCLAYWETSPAGKMTVLRTIKHVDMCPDCRELATAPHVCASR